MAAGNIEGGLTSAAQAFGDARTTKILHKIVVAAVLLGPVVTICCNWSMFPPPSAECVSDPSFESSQCGGDPPIALHEPSYQAGATLTVRGRPMASLGNTSLFTRVGVETPIDPVSRGSFPNVGGIAATSGQATLRESVSVPIVGGVSVPASTLGIAVPNLAFETFAGVQYNDQKLSLAVSEAGFPNTASGSASSGTLDPIVGAGIQYGLGSFAGIPVSLGVDGRYVFPTAPATVAAVSPNFLGVSYNVTGPGRPYPMLSTTLNFDLSAK
jgi:hypothetical protein